MLRKPIKKRQMCGIIRPKYFSLLHLAWNLYHGCVLFLTDRLNPASSVKFNSAGVVLALSSRILWLNIIIKKESWGSSEFMQIKGTVQYEDSHTSLKALSPIYCVYFQWCTCFMNILSKPISSGYESTMYLRNDLQYISLNLKVFSRYSPKQTNIFLSWTFGFVQLHAKKPVKVDSQAESCFLRLSSLSTDLFPWIFWWFLLQWGNSVWRAWPVPLPAGSLHYW